VKNNGESGFRQSLTERSKLKPNFCNLSSGQAEFVDRIGPFILVPQQFPASFARSGKSESVCRKGLKKFRTCLVSLSDSPRFSLER
jgi:hypothetical protein